MSETKHTPGPWTCEVSEESPNGLVLGRAGEDVVAEIQSNGQTATEVMANARLIAAAPELLGALEHMVAVANWSTTIQSEEQFDAMIADAEAAIRKAKGK
jgi:hypothetical protein